MTHSRFSHFSLMVNSTVMQPPVTLRSSLLSSNLQTLIVDYYSSNCQRRNSSSDLHVRSQANKREQPLQQSQSHFILHTQLKSFKSQIISLGRFWLSKQEGSKKWLKIKSPQSPKRSNKTLKPTECSMIGELEERGLILIQQEVENRSRHVGGSIPPSSSASCVWVKQILRVVYATDLWQT